jgi:hypothetical protein
MTMSTSGFSFPRVRLDSTLPLPSGFCPPRAAGIDVAISVDVDVGTLFSPHAAELDVVHGLDLCGNGNIRYILPRTLLLSLNLNSDVGILFSPRAAGPGLNVDVAVDVAVAVAVAINVEILFSPRTRVRLDSTSPLPSPLTSGFSSPRLQLDSTHVAGILFYRAQLDYRCRRRPQKSLQDADLCCLLSGFQLSLFQSINLFSLSSGQAAKAVIL